MTETMSERDGHVRIHWNGRTVGIGHGRKRHLKALMKGHTAARAHAAGKLRTLRTLMERHGNALPALYAQRQADVEALTGWLAAWDSAHERAV